jgi:hypothetical protein
MWPSDQNEFETLAVDGLSTLRLKICAFENKKLEEEQKFPEYSFSQGMMTTALYSHQRSNKLLLLLLSLLFYYPVKQFFSEVRRM